MRVLSTVPCRFSGIPSFQETEITTIYQMMWNTKISNSFAIVSVATARLKMKTLPTGFPITLRCAAIQFSDRHSKRSFLLLRIVHLLVVRCIFLASIQFSLPTHLVAISPLDCAIPTYVCILRDYPDLLPSFSSAGCATMSYFSTINVFESVCHRIKLFHHKPIQWLATYFLRFFHAGRASPSVPISSWPCCTFQHGIRPTSLLFLSFEEE